MCDNQQKRHTHNNNTTCKAGSGQVAGMHACRLQQHRYCCCCCQEQPTDAVPRRATCHQRTTRCQHAARAVLTQQQLTATYRHTQPLHRGTGLVMAATALAAPCRSMGQGAARIQSAVSVFATDVHAPSSDHQQRNLEVLQPVPSTTPASLLYSPAQKPLPCNANVQAPQPPSGDAGIVQRSRHQRASLRAPWLDSAAAPCTTPP